MSLIVKITLPIAFATLFYSQIAKSDTNEAPDSQWVLVAQNSDSTDIFSVKKGSFEFTKTKGGTTIAVVLGQLEDKKKKSVSYYKWYVTTDDCANGIGKLVMLKINGDFDFETDYVSGGKSIGSSIADTICGIYLDAIKTEKDKGV